MSDPEIYAGLDSVEGAQDGAEHSDAMQVLGKSDYTVTNTGRLTIPDFSLVTGAQTGQKFILIGPKGRTKTWRILASPEETAD